MVKKKEASGWLDDYLQAHPLVSGLVVVDGAVKVHDILEPFSGVEETLSVDALSALEERWLDLGTASNATGARRFPDARWDDLREAASDEVLSLLEATRLLGRNVVFAGPWWAAAPFLSAWGSEARLPIVIHGEGERHPVGTFASHDLSAALRVGADSVVNVSEDPVLRLETLRTCAAAAVWCEADRAERAVARVCCVEDASLWDGDVAPVGVDLVVTFDRRGGHLQAVHEVFAGIEHPNLRALFERRTLPDGRALVPLEAPSFTGELARVGFGALASVFAEHTEPDGVDDIPVAVPRPAARPPKLAPVADPGPALADEEDDNHEPGWELDELGPATPVPVDASDEPLSSDDAALAASHGLAPPPAPEGVDAASMMAGSFAQALSLVREQSRATDSDEDTYSPDGESDG